MLNENEDLKKVNKSLLRDIEILGQEMEFSLKEKESEIDHLKEKCKKCEKRESRQKARMNREMEAIRYFLIQKQQFKITEKQKRTIQNRTQKCKCPECKGFFQAKSFSPSTKLGPKFDPGR